MLNRQEIEEQARLRLERLVRQRMSILARRAEMSAQFRSELDEVDKQIDAALDEIDECVGAQPVLPFEDGEAEP